MKSSITKLIRRLLTRSASRPRQTAARGRKTNSPAHFQLDTRPVSTRALLRAARLGMACAMVVCLASALNASYAQAADLEAVKRNAKQGDAKAQYALGRSYENGVGVHESSAKAARWYRKAAEQGLAPAQYSLGRMYAAGLGVRKDDAQAIPWFRKAAAQDYALAMNRLGVMYERGHGVPEDCAEAYKWYTLAAGEKQNVFGVANRDALARRMTPERIAEGQHRAKLFRGLAVVEASTDGSGNRASAARCKLR